MAEKEKKAKKERKKSTFWKDFKAFISRGNIVDLAVAVVVGAAFTAIVNSLVNDIIKPLITWAVGGEDMSDLVIVLKTIYDDAGEVVDKVTLNYGNLIMAILTFLIDALVIFTIVRVIRNAKARIQAEAEKMKKKEIEEAAAQEAAPAEAAAPAAPAKPAVEDLLAEIRDLLKASGNAAAAELPAEAATKESEKSK